MKSIKICFAVIIVLIAAVLVFSCASTGGEKPVVEGYRWNFDDPEAGTAGWATAPDEYWDFKGTMAVSRDATTMGKPMLRVDVDFSKDVGSWWSEPKIKYEFSEPFDMKGITRLAFDMYINPANSTTGSFKGKAMLFFDKSTVAEAELDLILPKEEVGSYMKATVVYRLRSSRNINNVVIGIVGAVTNYNGPIFIDNLRLE